MSDQLTIPAAGPRHPDFGHVAVYHDGDDDLAARLAPEIERALDDGDAVLLCSRPAVWQLVAARLGPASELVEYVPGAVRYGHPNVSMRILHDFVRDCMRTGARAAWSIGAIPFNDDEIRTADWMRYEQAVNEVLQHLPLRAVCTYDVATTPSELLDKARSARSNGHGEGSSQPDGERQRVVPPIELPATEPMLRFDVHGSRSARQTVAAAYADLLDDDAVGELTLIVSELVSNALTHGAPPVTLSAWHDAAADATVVDVSDHGPGIDDPFVDLRPPRQGPWWSRHVDRRPVERARHLTVRRRRAPRHGAPPPRASVQRLTRVALLSRPAR